MRFAGSVGILFFTMAPQSTDDIRQAYLDFFKEKHDHAIIAGASLIPENDPTVLFTTAGMHPLVPYLLGEPHPAGTRLTDVQRCVRTQDIDEVGDNTHLTMFEMLGNWSLGDYFKEGAIKMSYEFLTEVLGIDPSMLAVTCFAGDSDAPRDDEAADIWRSVGMPDDRIAFLPKSENWWGPAGATGPCGPDTEMFYWVGEGTPHDNPGDNEDDWMEIWNDVFMQYNKQADSSFPPLAKQCVDTGMGLERVAAVMQNASTVYETDRFVPMMDTVKNMANSDNPQHTRIVVDHLKAATFIVADGARPGNVDQGYVLRRLIRRAIRSARQLGIEGNFCAAISEVVVKQYGHVYSHVAKQQDEIAAVLTEEEERFSTTLKEGMKQFTKVSEAASGTIAGVDAFHLYDTYGFPLELTKEMANEQHLTVDEEGFDAAFKEHQEKSRAGAEKKFSGGLADHSDETTKLHTATHLLNAALRQVLGDHIQQKGSNITAERLRFDFNHDEKMTPEQKEEVERLVNEAIAADLPITYHLTTVDGAKDEGAIGVFDDRYGNEVKVYTVGDGSFSKEICGGPHVARTGMLGTFKIKKEESSSAGVRRIKAVLSDGPEKIEVAPQVNGS